MKESAPRLILNDMVSLRVAELSIVASSRLKCKQISILVTMLTAHRLLTAKCCGSHNIATLVLGEDGMHLEDPVGGTDGQSMKEFRQSPPKC
jgi:hypothetical protein